MNIPRTPGSQIAQIMKRPASSAVAVTTLTALGAAPTPVVTRTMLDDRFGQLAWIGNTLGAIGNIFSRFHNSAFLPPANRSAELDHYLDKNPTTLLQSPIFYYLSVGIRG